MLKRLMREKTVKRGDHLSLTHCQFLFACPSSAKIAGPVKGQGWGGAPLLCKKITMSVHAGRSHNSHRLPIPPPLLEILVVFPEVEYLAQERVNNSGHKTQFKCVLLVSLHPLSHSDKMGWRLVALSSVTPAPHSCWDVAGMGYPWTVPMFTQELAYLPWANQKYLRLLFLLCKDPCNNVSPGVVKSSVKFLKTF